MAAVTLSTNLDQEEADKVKSLAAREHRSVSNVLATAALLFTELPKEVRDTLLELRVAPDKSRMRFLIREMQALVARMNFDRAAAQLARQNRFEGDEEVSELEMLEQATEISRGQ